MKFTVSQFLRRHRRVLTAVALAVAAVAVGVNLWLLFGGHVGVKTSKTHFHWTRAWMLIPGRIVVKDLRISAQTPSDHWQLEVEHTRARVTLSALLKRHFILEEGAARGAEFRLRRRPFPGEDLSSASPHLPVIEGFEISHREPREPKKRPWRFTLGNLEFRNVDRLWVDRIELRNPKRTGLVSGDADFIVRGVMSLDAVRFAVDGAELWLGGERVGQDLDILSEASLRPIEPAALRRPESFRNLDGHIDVRGVAESLGFIRTLLPERLRRLELSGGGALDARVHIDRGRLTEPSTLTVETTDLDVRFGAYRGRGRGRIDADVRSADVEADPGGDRGDGGDGDVRQAAVHIRLEDVEVDAGLGPKGDGDLGADAVAERFQVVIKGLDPTLGRPLVDPEVLLELPTFEIPDLARFDALIPGGLDLDILGGKARLRAQLRLSPEAEDTVFELAADDARLEYRGTRIGGRLRIGGRSVGTPPDPEDSAPRRIQVHDLGVTFDGATRPRASRAEATPVGFALELGPLDLAMRGRSAGGPRLRLLSETLEAKGRFDDLGWWDVKGKLSQGLHLRGRGTLEARVGLDHSGDKPRLTDDRELTLRITRFDLPDLREFGDLLPKDAGLRLDGGRGVARGRFTLRGRREALDFTVDAREVDLNFRDTAIRGDLTLRGRSTGNLKSERMVLRDVALDFKGTTATDAGARPVQFRLDLGDTDIRLPNRREGRKLRLASGVVELTGHVDDLGWWETPLAGEKWLELQGRASLAATLRVRETATGIALGAPSEITAELPDLVAVLGDWRAAAKGELRGRLEATGSRLSLDLDGPTLSQEGQPDLFLPTLRLEATGPRLTRGRKVEGVRVRLDAEPAELPSLSMLNAYLPAGKLQFESGLGALRGYLELSKNRAGAAFELRSDGAVAQVSGKTVSARINLDADLSSADPASRRLRINRGEVLLRDVVFADIPDTRANWWALGTIRGGWVTAAKPIALDAEVEMRLRDPQPIVHLVGEDRRTLQWIARVLDIKNVHGTGRMILDDGGLRFEDLDIRGDDLRVRGHIDLEEPVRSLLLIQYRQFFVGVEKVGDDRDLRLFRPAEWFEERSRLWRSRPRPARPDPR